MSGCGDRCSGGLFGNTDISEVIDQLTRSICDISFLTNTAQTLAIINRHSQQLQHLSHHQPWFHTSPFPSNAKRVLIWTRTWTLYHISPVCVCLSPYHIWYINPGGPARTPRLHRELKCQRRSTPGCMDVTRYSPVTWDSRDAHGWWYLTLCFGFVIMDGWSANHLYCLGWFVIFLDLDTGLQPSRYVPIAAPYEVPSWDVGRGKGNKDWLYNMTIIINDFYTSWIHPD